MPASRKILFWFSRSVLHLIVIMTIFSATTASLLGSPAALKEVLSKSGAYDYVISAALSKANQPGQEGSESPDIDPQIKEAVNQILTPQKLQSIVEQVADGTYNWLDGKTDKPDFQIDITAEKVALAGAVADRGVNRVAGLPVCKRIPANYDPFETDCRPPNFNADTERTRLQNLMLANENFLPNAVITADNLPKDQNGQTFTEKFSNLPKAFRFMKLLPWIFLGLVVLAATSVIFAAETKRKGINKVGNVLFWDGVFIIGATLIFGKFLPGLIANNQAKMVSGGSNPILASVLQQSSGKIAHYILIFSAITAAVGAGIYLVERFTRPGGKTKTSSKPKKR